MTFELYTLLAVRIAGLENDEEARERST